MEVVEDNCGRIAQGQALKKEAYASFKIPWMRFEQGLRTKAD